ncbi:MAG: hypothetical protein JETT_3369 [Candidatus Jettenia ecosi]|uniref:Uncharacterized protein n=1 Tax=Candidatus Jettenia ecosi TaxID=2494326 RepID=A0A533Q720_9BACT|nr:MAG: hypothetical protein JETT_3369 [Candidatus Jettenia ecosi]
MNEAFGTFIFYQTVGQGFSLASPLEHAQGRATPKDCLTELKFLDIKIIRCEGIKNMKFKR